MPKTFEYKQAKEQIGFFKNFVPELKKNTGFGADCKNDLLQQTNILHTSGYFSRTVEQGLQGKEIGSDDNGTKNFLSDIYFFKEATDLSDKCNVLYERNAATIERLVSSLNSGSNALFWFFSSRKKKAAAEDAYEKLNNLKNGYAVAYANEVFDKIANLKATSYDVIKRNYSENMSEYGNWLQKANEAAFTEHGYVPVVERLDGQYKAIADKSNEIKSAVKNAVCDIESAVENFLNEELIVALKGISVDELARDKSGIKPKYLKDAGYENIADIYGLSAARLAGIYGISYEKACLIKGKCDGYADKMKSGLKIRLSADKKTKAATDVVRAIYSYIKKSDYEKQIKKLDKDYGNDVKSALKVLYRLGNGVKWLFISEDEKSRIKKAYFYLKNTLDTIYKPLIDTVYKDFRRLTSPANDKAWNDFSANSIRYYNVIEEFCPNVLGTDDSIYGLPEYLAEQIKNQPILSDGLLCTLRRYQEWGVKYALCQKRVLLGDEMGLGKTIQAIACMVSLKNAGATRFLVVCPASVVTNWCREISKHSTLKAIEIHGAGKSSAFEEWVENGGVAVTNYESTSHLTLKDDYRFSLLVVDEAHYIKNAAARRSVNTKKLARHADGLLFMTGTALENKVDEMISLISILRPTIAEQIKDLAFMSSAPQFREKIAPVYYRRKREDVLTELPDKIESKEWCALNAEEEAIYENAVLSGRYNDARRVSWNVSDLNKSCKAQRLKEIVEEAEEEGRKVLVFSFFLDTISKIYNYLQEKCLSPITGSVSVAARQEIIDEFDGSPAGTVLLAQINSGGTGLNIQAASVVVICEPQFKPSIENQAVSRAYRMGQARNVLVYRLLCENTVDEKLIDVLEEKQVVFDTFADKSVAAGKCAEIDEKTFGKIIKEEIERINIKRGESAFLNNRNKNAP